jgi:hypothetical protein
LGLLSLPKEGQTGSQQNSLNSLHCPLCQHLSNVRVQTAQNGNATSTQSRWFSTLWRITPGRSCSPHITLHNAYGTACSGRSRSLYCHTCLVPLLPGTPRLTLPVHFNIITHHEEAVRSMCKCDAMLSQEQLLGT